MEFIYELEADGGCERYIFEVARSSESAEEIVELGPTNRTNMIESRPPVRKIKRFRFMN